MNRDLNQILEDIYSVDGSLRQHEEKLREIIHGLLANRPEFGADPAFRQSLRNELLSRIHSLKLDGSSNKLNNIFSIMQILQSKYFPLGASLAVILVVGVLMFGSGKPDGEQLTLAPSTTKVADMAFGPLNAGQNQNESAAPRGGGGLGGGSAGISFRSQSGGGGGGSPAMDMAVSSGMTMPYPYSVYKYKYAGEPLELTDTTVEVLRRIRGNLGPMSSILRSLNLSGIDFNSFGNLGVQNINLMEDKEYGYSVYIDFFEGSLSINQNWLRWPNPMAECREQTCFDSLRIKSEDVPSDSEAISIADAFLSEHGIDRSSLGSPEVINDWRVMYQRATSAERLSMWVPEQVTIVYPLIVDGKPVYEDGGGRKFGVTVSVDIRAKRVAGVYNLFSQNYERSNYEAQTDVAEVLKMVERGGRYPMYGYDGAQIKTIKVGTPTAGYIRAWIPQGMQSMELLVPALIFPVLENPDPAGNPVQNIVVPLAKELYNLPDQYPVPYGGPIEKMAVPPVPVMIAPDSSGGAPEMQ